MSCQPEAAQNFELSISRHIDAPPERVWDVMVNRQNDWWCPRPWRSELIAQERRPGGRSAVIMYGPEGEVMPHEGIFLAWDEGRRFVSTDACNADFEPMGPFMIGIWEIAPDGTGTRYTASARHWNEETMTQHRDMGFEEGWLACAAQLAALCEME